MKVLSYNIWNTPCNMKERMKDIAQYINDSNYDIVCLQEVTWYSAILLEKDLDNYDFFYKSDCWYFNMCLVRKDVTYVKGIIMNFTNSIMERHLIAIEMLDKVIITSHLESGLQSERTRRLQLKEITEFTQKHYNDKYVIFVGDTNLVEESRLNNASSDFENAKFEDYRENKRECDKLLDDWFESWTEIHNQNEFNSYDPRYNLTCTDNRSVHIDRLFVYGNNDNNNKISMNINGSTDSNHIFNTMSDHYSVDIII